MSAQRNLLSGNHQQPPTWQSVEDQLWCKSFSTLFLGNVLLSCLLRLLHSLLSGSSLVKVFLGISSAVLIVLILSLFFGSRQSTHTRIRLATVFLHLSQAYFVFLCIIAYPEHLSIISVSSTFLCLNYELRSTSSKSMVFYLLFRQFAMWHVAEMVIHQREFTFQLPYIILLGSFVPTLLYTKQTQARTIELYELFSKSEEKDRRLSSLLQAIPEGLAVVSASRSLSCFNQQMSGLLGCSSLTDTALISILEDVFCFSSIDTETLKAQSLMEEVRSFLLDSSEPYMTFGVWKRGDTYLEWKGSRCTWDDLSACILTVTDISSWVALRKIAQQESDSKSTLLRFVSHELRTPTNAILNLVGEVSDGSNLTPAQHTDLSMVLASTHFLLGVINDLLDFSKLMADKFVVVKADFDLRKELQDTVNLVSLQCIRKGIYIRLNVDSLIPEWVYSDGNRLKQVLLNLLSNALKFTVNGGIEVVAMMTNLDLVRISVSDTGVGIPPDKLPCLFQAFTIIEGTQHLNPQGCGLGLSIANRIVQSLGPSSIHVQSTLGCGSVFSFEIETARIMQGEESPGVSDYTTEIAWEESPALPMKFSLSMQRRGTLPKVLVVDDSDFNRAVLCAMLARYQIHCDEAETGLRALALVQTRIARGSHYLLILMDVEMPEMDGLSATREIRRLESLGRMAIIGCSAHTPTQEALERCRAAGMDGYLEKPVNRRMLEPYIALLA